MNRFILNLLAGATILVGGWMLLSPAPASADPDPACCTVTIRYSDGSTVERKCCGGQCELDENNACKACSGAECTL